MSAHARTACLDASEACLQTARARERTGRARCSVRARLCVCMGLAVACRQPDISITYRLGLTTLQAPVRGSVLSPIDRTPYMPSPGRDTPSPLP